MTASNFAAVERFWDSINARDVEGYLATFTETAVAYDPYSAPPLSSESARRAHLSGLLEIFPELEATLDFVCALADRTAVKWRVNARGVDGRAVTLEGIDIYRHAPDGRIAEMWGYFES